MVTSTATLLDFEYVRHTVFDVHYNVHRTMYIYIYRWVYKFTCWSLLFSNNGSLPGHTRTSVVAHIHTLTITRTHSHFHSHLHIVTHSLSFTLVHHILIIAHSYKTHSNTHTLEPQWSRQLAHILQDTHPHHKLSPYDIAWPYNIQCTTCICIRIVI